jgi:hypothetical protein
MVKKIILFTLATCFGFYTKFVISLIWRKYAYYLRAGIYISDICISAQHKLSSALRSNICGIIEGTRQGLRRDILYRRLLFVHDQILNQVQPLRVPEAVPPRYLHFISLIMFSCYNCQVRRSICELQTRFIRK